MSYPRDLDELHIDTLARELMKRVAARARGICDYCGRAPTTTPCKFPERHANTVPLISVEVTKNHIIYDHDGAARVIMNEDDAA